jgi:hypothetical protein
MVALPFPLWAWLVFAGLVLALLVLDLFVLHRNADRLSTRGWSGLYWARRTPSGDYEIRSVARKGEALAPNPELLRRVSRTPPSGKPHRGRSGIEPGRSTCRRSMVQSSVLQRASQV